VTFIKSKTCGYIEKIGLMNNRSKPNLAIYFLPSGILSFFERSYELIRRGRNSAGGGILVLCRREYKILKKEVSMDAEIKNVLILGKSTIFNFLA
jgi:hypothetical protein